MIVIVCVCAVFVNLSCSAKVLNILPLRRYRTKTLASVSGDRAASLKKCSKKLERAFRFRLSPHRVSLTGSQLSTALKKIATRSKLSSNVLSMNNHLHASCLDPHTASSKVKGIRLTNHTRTKDKTIRILQNGKRIMQLRQQHSSNNSNNPRRQRLLPQLQHPPRPRTITMNNFFVMRTITEKMQRDITTELGRRL